MPTFDYITAKEFRESLEADYAEMKKCFEVRAWKGSQVLAGSIVETLLLDYIVSTGNSSRVSKDPLKMDLAEAISICRSESVLTDRTGDLCSVIRSYRNLIHPGRMVRLGEQPPNRESASIALALVDIITEEISKARRATVGLTAEQILSKLVRDSSSITILKHLLNETHEQQRERLLLELIPSAHLYYENAEIHQNDNTTDRLGQAYRIILDSVSTSTKERVAAEFVRILREEDGDRVIAYGSAFFEAGDLKYVSINHRAMVKEHLLGKIGSSHSKESIKIVGGIGEFLEPNDIEKYLDPFIRTFASITTKSSLKELVSASLTTEAMRTSKAVNDAIDKRVNDWIAHYENSKNAHNVAILQKLKEEIETWRLI